jgi:ubiquinone/menaquinone biosynthesis C-methylase UbiE
MDIATIKQRQQATWASGDFSAVGARILITAELLCEAVDLRAGQQVLDVACGSGNAALAGARRFCQVVGVDYVPALLERARQRAAA